MKITNQLGYKGYYLSRVSCGGKEHLVTDLSIEGGSYKIISSGALKGFDNLEHLSVPEGVTSLEEELCAGMTKLKSVKLPESLTYIGDECFKGCTSIEEIVIPAGIEDIGSEFIRGCTSLKRIVMKGIDHISERGVSKRAFYDLYEPIREGAIAFEFPDETSRPILEYTSDMGEYTLPQGFEDMLRALPPAKQMLYYRLSYAISFEEPRFVEHFYPYYMLEFWHDITGLIVNNGALVGFVINKYEEGGIKTAQNIFPCTKAPYNLELYHSFTGDNNGAGYKGDDGGYYRRNYLSLVPVVKEK